MSDQSAIASAMSVHQLFGETLKPWTGREMTAPKIIHWRYLINADGVSSGLLLLDETGALHCNGDATPLFQLGASLHPDVDPQLHLATIEADCVSNPP